MKSGRTLITNSYDSQELHGYELHDIGNLDLEERGTTAASRALGFSSLDDFIIKFMSAYFSVI